jgi:hypothetical protein
MPSAQFRAVSSWLDHGLVSSGGKRGSQLPTLIQVWFTADLVVALFAPAHWADERERSDPRHSEVVFYLYGTSLIIAASVVAAHFADRPVRSHQREPGGPWSC